MRVQRTTLPSQFPYILTPCSTASRPPRKRARKSHNACAGRSDIRTVGKRKGKGRKTAGSLSELVNMPLDVFFEVRPI